MYSVVGSDGQVYGPVDMAILTQWIAEGRVGPNTSLIDPLDGRVVLAGQAPALMGSFPDAPPQAPPVPGPYANLGAGGFANPMVGYPRPAPTAFYGPSKSKIAAILLALFLGGLGVHRFYLGHTATGVAMLALFFASFFSCGLTGIAVGVWAIVDVVLIATDTLREANGRALT